MNSDRTEAHKAEILIVDDTPNNLRLLAAILTEDGYKVRKSLTGKMALVSCQAAVPDLILLDINMPEMNGYEVCEHLKANEQTREVPVIFISALSEAIDKVKAFQIGGVDYINKPFHNEEVLARIENQLNLRRLQKQLSEKNSLLQQELHQRNRVEIALVERVKLAALNSDVGLALIKGNTLRDMLGRCAIALYQHLDAAFARIWTVNEATGMLELQASAGMYVHLDGAHSRIPVGQFKIGLIARERQPHLTNDVQNDPRVSDKEWANREGMVAFAGYPLIVEERCIGVMAIFARHPLTNVTLETMAAVANNIALGSERLRSQEFISRSNALLKAQQEAALDGILAIDENRRIFSYNQRFCELWQIPDAIVSSGDDQQMLNWVLSQLENPQEFLSKVEFLYAHRTEISRDEIAFKDGRIFDRYSAPVRSTIGGYYGRVWYFRDITERKQAEISLREAKQESEDLLLNILPKTIADRLKQDTSAIAEQFDEVTILFADIVGFTPLSARMSPKELVNLLNQIFSIFDELTLTHDLEKIKTIGDAYMVVAGLPEPRPDHAEAIAQMALDMQRAIIQFQADTGEPFEIRIGINTGPVIAGVIGIKKFIYDLWGDTVNVASRMESQGMANRIQVTAETYERLKDQYLFEKREKIFVKGKGEMITYWLLGKEQDKDGKRKI